MDHGFHDPEAMNVQQGRVIELTRLYDRRWTAVVEPVVSSGHE
jgi:hypothetical protein